MELLWVSTWYGERHTGGSGAFARGILRLAEAAFPHARMVRIAPVASQPPRRLRQALSIARSVGSAHSAKWHFDHAPEVAATLREQLAASSPDAVFLMGTAAGAFLDELPGSAARILIAPGVESAFYRAQLERAPAAVRGLLARGLRDAEKHGRFERCVLAAVDACVAVSDETREGLDALAGRMLPAIVVPPIFPRDERTRARQASGSGTRLGFLARLSWWPNREAIDWFLREVWPGARRPGLTLHIYGEGSEAFDRRTEDVHGHGFVENAADAWDSIDVFVNPTLTSTGVNVKACEAIHAGVPLLTSVEGARGLDLRGDPSIVVCRTREDWIAALQPARLEPLARTAPAESLRRFFEPQAHAAAFRALIEPLALSSPCRPAASSA